MKNRLYKTWCIISAFGLSLSYGIYSYGCADGWWDYSDHSVLTPEAFADESYKPLFYAPYDKFYDYSSMNNVSMFTPGMLEDWKEYLKGLVPEKDIEECLLFTPSEQLSFEDYFMGLTPKIEREWDYKNKKVVGFLTFLNLAKKLEFYSTQSYDYWDYDSYQAVLLDRDMAQAVERSYFDQVAINEDLDDFLKNRLWFQVMKAYFYSENRYAVVDFFFATKDSQPKNELYYRALGYVGGAYYQVGDYQNSNRIFAEVFDQSPVLRQVALYNFKALPQKDIEGLAQTVDNSSTKAALWALYGYYTMDQTLEAMQKIYVVDPGSKHLDFLLTRWINLKEAEVTQLNPKDFKNKKEYLKKVNTVLDKNKVDWIQKTAQSTKQLHNPALWQIASGYLCILQGNNTRAAEFLNKAKTLEIKSPLVSQQIRLFEIINQVDQLQSISNQGPTGLLDDLQWLLNDLNKDQVAQESSFRYSFGQSWVRQKLADLYLKEDQRVLSEIVYPNLSFYDSLENTQAMEDFLSKGSFNAWEKILLENYPIYLQELYQQKAILLFYQDKLQESLAYMQKATSVTKKDYFGQDYTYKLKDYELLGNPFNGKIKDCNDCDHAAKQSVKYTKETFLQKMIEMQDKIAQNQEVYNNALLLGNAFYNTTYFGNARMFYHSRLFAENSNYIEEQTQKYILNMDLAKKYYTLAFNNATNDEQKAKIAYLLAKIQRNEFYNQKYLRNNYFSMIYGDDTAFLAWQGFQDLYNLYRDTKYYQEVIKECGYFKTYLDQQ
ncbi:hypothetical protein ACYSNX_11425 [Myroides sp. LJL115]